MRDSIPAAYSIVCPVFCTIGAILDHDQLQNAKPNANAAEVTSCSLPLNSTIWMNAESNERKNNIATEAHKQDDI